MNKNKKCKNKARAATEVELGSLKAQSKSPSTFIVDLSATRRTRSSSPRNSMPVIRSISSNLSRFVILFFKNKKEPDRMNFKFFLPPLDERNVIRQSAIEVSKVKLPSFFFVNKNARRVFT